MVKQSGNFAARLRMHSRDLSQKIDYACRLALARPPSTKKLRLLSDYSNHRGIINLARLIFNSNEFLFVD